MYLTSEHEKFIKSLMPQIKPDVYWKIGCSPVIRAEILTYIFEHFPWLKNNFVGVDNTDTHDIIITSCAPVVNLVLDYDGRHRVKGYDPSFTVDNYSTDVLADLEKRKKDKDWQVMRHQGSSWLESQNSQILNGLSE